MAGRQVHLKIKKSACVAGTVAVCCGVLQGGAVRCSALQCVAMRCSEV